MIAMQNRCVFLLVALALILVSACGTTEPSRFYLLSEETESGRSGPGGSGGSGSGGHGGSGSGGHGGSGSGRHGGGSAIQVGPITFPEYLDRSQIVTRAGRNGVALAEYDRWAEPLDDNFTDVLVENLSNLLSTDRIALFPRRTESPAAYHLAVDVIRLDGDDSGDVTLSARWTLSAGGGGSAIAKKKSILVESGIDMEDFEALVQAKSRLLAALCREIAGAIGKNERRAPAPDPAGA